MLNKEKYKDKIEEIFSYTIGVTKSGEMCRCKDMGGCYKCIFHGGNCVDNARYWLNSEYQILDDAEKRYLKGVIRPFRDKVKCISKHYDGREWIVIEIINDVKINFPYFEKGSMYRGMELYKNYTIEELGL